MAATVFGQTFAFPCSIRRHGMNEVTMYYGVHSDILTGVNPVSACRPHRGPDRAITCVAQILAWPSKYPESFSRHDLSVFFRQRVGERSCESKDSELSDGLSIGELVDSEHGHCRL
jgi:hypothetical protein